MIGSIDNQADIDIFLEEDEVAALKVRNIEGVLIKIMAPEYQGRVSLGIDQSRVCRHIGVDDSCYWGVDDFRVHVSMGPEWYQKLLERGAADSRQNMRDGSKIHIYDRSRLSTFDDFQAQSLEFYRDHHAKLIEFRDKNR